MRELSDSFWNKIIELPDLVDKVLQPCFNVNTLKNFFSYFLWLYHAITKLALGLNPVPFSGFPPGLWFYPKWKLKLWWRLFSLQIILKILSLSIIFLLTHTHTYTYNKQRKQNKKRKKGPSLVAQWLGVCLRVQGTRVRALVWEDPTCRGATGPVSHNYWACASGAYALQQERPQ